ncbi:Transposase [Bacillus cereus Rock4-2]|nr:Transposase [Bacillus cereus Rock4-2]
MKKEKSIPSGMRLRKQKHLNKIVEQDQHFMLGLKYFETSTSILSGV